MSVSPDMIADVINVAVSEVSCKNCSWHGEFIKEALWCNGWNQKTGPYDFCSFFQPLTNSIEGEKIQNDRRC